MNVFKIFHITICKFTEKFLFCNIFFVEKWCIIKLFFIKFYSLIAIRIFSNYKNKNMENANSKNDMMIGSRIPPHSLSAEKSVIGGMIIDRQAIPKVLEIITAESFYDPRHQIIYTAITSLFNKNIAVDIITLTDELQLLGKYDDIGGVVYLTEISSYTPTSSNIENHAKIVQEKYLKRLLINTCGEIIGDAYSDTSDALDEIDKAESSIFAIAEKRMKKSYVGIKELARDTFKLISSLKSRSEDSLTGVPSGYKHLDEMLGGFQNSDLIIIAARPSMGKTAFALSIARNTALEFNNSVALFSIEMASVQLVMRLISAEAMIDQQKVRNGRINHGDEQKLVKAIGRLSESPIIIDDSPTLSVIELRAKCRRLKAEHGIKLVIVDYLQLIQSPKAESREREISIISASLKSIAKELEIPVIALAQLNRSVEGRTDKRPMLSDLRESGSIEQDADVVMFINRPEFYGIKNYDDEHKTPTEGTAEIIIGKQRNGPVGKVRLAFQQQYARFENLAQFHTPDEDIPPGENFEDYGLDDDEPDF
jgi:replicative DNA helicase